MSAAMDGSSPELTPRPATTSGDRLDSWKAISAYLKRDVTTVQRWEKREGMPVHRHVHDKLGSVYAFKTELDEWVSQRKPAAAAEPLAFEPPRSRRATWIAAAIIIIVMASFLVWQWPDTSPPAAIASLDRAQFTMLTDSEGA